MITVTRPPGPRIGSLCSGYGGLDMGLQMVHGGTVAWHAEYDDAPARILAHHWPDVPNLRDITTADWTTVEPVDWLTAGYPCQPFSLAGKRKGADDERHLWPYVADAIGALRPGRVLLENVAGHVSMGLDAVLGDLAALGYDARWGVVRASDTGAPHGRARLFIVAADTDSERSDRSGLHGPGQRRGTEPTYRDLAAADPSRDRRDQRRTEPAGQLRGPDAPLGRDAAPDPDGDGLESVRGIVGIERDADGRHRPDVAWGPYEPAIERWERTIGRPAPRPTEPGRNGPRLSPAFVEWMQGLPRGHVTDVPGLTRNAQLKALGNGVVPQQAALALHLLERAA